MPLPFWPEPHGPEPDPHGPEPGPQLPVGQGAVVSPDGILPSETSESYFEDHAARSEVAHAGVTTGLCESAVAAKAAIAAKLIFIVEL